MPFKQNSYIFPHIFLIFQSGCRQTRGKLRLLSPSKLKLLRKGLCLKRKIDKAFGSEGNFNRKTIFNLKITNNLNLKICTVIIVLESLQSTADPVEVDEKLPSDLFVNFSLKLIMSC